MAAIFLGGCVVGWALARAFIAARNALERRAYLRRMDHLSESSA